MENAITSNTAEAAAAKLEAAVKNAGWGRNPADPKRVESLVAFVGTPSREEYLALRDVWRERYRALSLECRRTKPLRKGGNTDAMGACDRMKADARRYMAVRHALKSLARAHAAQRHAVAV